MSTREQLRIDARVDAGVRWYLRTVPAKNRAQVDVDDIVMGDDYSDVLSLAYDGENSETVRANLDLSDDEARDYGILFIAADGKDYDERTSEEDEEVDEEYDMLGDAWRERLQALEDRSPQEKFDDWARAKHGPLAALETYTFTDLQEAFQAGTQAA